MNKYTPDFREAVKDLVENYTKKDLHPAIVAQWILESDRGNSKLAREFRNFAGMKWRDELINFGEGRLINVPSEPAPVRFAWFKTIQDFVDGFYRFLDRSPYVGWRDTKSPEEYIEHIGGTWATDLAYIAKVKALIPEARELIEQLRNGTMGAVQPTWFELYKVGNDISLIAMAGSQALWQMTVKRLSEIKQICDLYGDHNVEVAPAAKVRPIVPTLHLDDLKESPTETGKPPGSREPVAKPVVRWVRSPNFSARGGSRIDSIVLHYTTSRNINGTISWFQTPISRVSAHYIVGRDGEIVQMVRDSDKAWHAAGHNDSSIGIEHCAAKGDKLTPAQEAATIKLCRWLMTEYRIIKKHIQGHRWLPNSTSCPGDLWPTEQDLRAWVDKNL